VRRVVLPLLLAAAAVADPTSELLLQARHALYVKGDPGAAIALFERALQDRALSPARQAEIHLRIALCWEELEDWPEALHHLGPHMFEAAPEELKQLAARARQRVEARLPDVAAPEPGAVPDPDTLRRAKLDEALRLARKYLAKEDDLRALVHVQVALGLDPDHAEARRLEGELETRLSGVADFMRDPLKWLGAWTQARVAQVTRLAEGHLIEAVGHADKGRFNLAETSFRQAIEVVDACEFAPESDRLAALRYRIRARWRRVRARELGEAQAEPSIPTVERRKTHRGEFLDHLQRMLDLVSGEGREYRILPVRTRRSATSGWRRKPAAFSLFRDLASSWTASLFARRYLPRRVEPDSWSQEGNYLEAAGGLLVARNRPAVLDALQREIRRLAEPSPATVPGRFLVVPFPRAALPRLAKELGDFEVSHQGTAPILFRVVPAQFSLDYVCSVLLDLGAEVRPARDTFVTEIDNGAPQTFFVAEPLLGTRGYEAFEAGSGPATETHFGLLLDVYPLRDADGRTALALRMRTQIPAPPLESGRALTPRFLTEQAELFADLPPGTTLLVAGLRDPFAAAHGTDAAESTALVLWANEGAGREPAPSDGGPIGADVFLRRLLVDVRDDPGPVRSEEHGFLARERLDVLASRARFLQEFLRDELGSKEISVLAEEAVARVPPALREVAADKIAEMERESERSYVVRIQTLAVRTAVLERWLEREGLAPQPFGGGAVVLADAPSGEFLLRTLEPTEGADVFAPRREWPRPTALGLQARHALSARVHTSPAYGNEADLAKGRTRTVTEGLRITIRPFSWDGRLRLQVEVETSALENETEERALALAVPSYRTRAGGSRVAGTLDLGPPLRPKTALLRGIPHPTASRPERLTEIVVALSVRNVP